MIIINISFLNAELVPVEDATDPAMWNSHDIKSLNSVITAMKKI